MIFNLFKSKPTLKELIPKGFVDIHSHILPGIDDGAKDVNESVKLITEMKKLGFSKIIGTPHTYAGLYENTNETINDAFRKLKVKIPKGIEIGFASEYMIDESIINKANEKQLLCIKDNFILVEMSYVAPPRFLFEIIFELRVNGYIPILAHPERYFFLHVDKKKYHKLKNAGCLFQINLLSTTGYYGEDVLKISDYLIQENMIEYCGSDTHSIKHINQIKNSTVKLKKINNFNRILNANQNFY